MKKLFIVLFSFLYAVGLTACKETKTQTSTKQEVTVQQSVLEEGEEDIKEENTLDFSKETRQIATKDNIILKYGQIYDVYDGNETGRDNILILQVMLPLAEDEDTVLEQNFSNIEDLIKNQNGSAYDRIEYNAKVRDMEDKIQDVLRFSVDKNCMNQIVTSTITTQEYESYVTDLWIAALPIMTLEGYQQFITTEEENNGTTDTETSISIDTIAP